MATGDITWFQEAQKYSKHWGSTDVLKIAILDNTTTPTAADTTPALADYTQVGTAGTYTAGGTSLGTYGDFLAEAAGVLTYDTATNPSWAQDASNDTDAYWGLVYNDTDAGDAALCFIELGGPADMSAGALTITWNVLGLATETLV